MKQIYRAEIERYTYDSEEERENHAKEMHKSGWEVSPKCRLKLSKSTSESDDDYIWFAEFCKEE